MDHDSSKAEGHHGAHYWCPGCWNSNVSVVVRGGITVALSPTIRQVWELFLLKLQCQEGLT
jgi:hypothetical protein